jgi:hypothetical protein
MTDWTTTDAHRPILTAFAFLTEAGFEARPFRNGSDHGTVGVLFEGSHARVTIERGPTFDARYEVRVGRPAPEDPGTSEGWRERLARGVAPWYDLHDIVQLSSGGRAELRSGIVDLGSLPARDRERADLEMNATWLRDHAAAPLRGDYDALRPLDERFIARMKEWPGTDGPR